MRRPALPLSTLLVATLVAIGTLPACAPGEDRPAEPLFENLGSYEWIVSTDSPEAQRYFNQGMIFCWGFNHEEAIRSFEQAAALDPDLAMAYWGIALASGPHINNPEMDEAASLTAWENLQRAVGLLGKASPLEQELIEALRARYADPPPEDRVPLDQAYADAMRAVWTAHPENANVGALCAEAVMDLRPWDLWSPEGEPRPETPEVIETLTAVLTLDPEHPGANHFNIHTLEASPEPERAAESADRLRDMVPGLGHLTHMPSHIDIRLGQYQEAILANQRAVAADSAYLEQGGSGAFFTLYSAHNYHFLAYAAMFAGRQQLAMESARQMVVMIPLDLVYALPDFMDGFLPIPYHVMIRFGMWNEMLAEPAPPADLPVTTAFWLYARTVAFAALGRVDEATVELVKFEEAFENVPESALIGNNSAIAVLEVARPFAAGELEYRLGNTETAFELLYEAVALDDALRYDEPWGWMEPVRHALGALLLEQGRVEDAEAVYREDLRIHPGNGWALLGLEECLRRSGNAQAAAEVQKRLDVAWANADINTKVSCYCRRGD
jgi:tetratricopeptide (TPR) repeat protein